MSGDYDRCPWYHEAYQWLWSLVGVLAVLLGVALCAEQYQRTVSDAELKNEQVHMSDDGAENTRLAADLREFQGILDRYAEQKEQETQQIADYEKAIDLLNQKTKRLGLVLDNLKELNATFADFRTAEGEFNRNRRTLEEKAGFPRP